MRPSDPRDDLIKTYIIAIVVFVFLSIFLFGGLLWSLT